MILDALESFVMFGTILALAGFAIVGLARLLGRIERFVVPPRIVAGLCTGAVVAPPVVAAWLVTAALLPLVWMDGPTVWAAHGTSPHATHLVGDLTADIIPGFAYAALLFVGISAVLSGWTTARGHRRLSWAVAQLEIIGPLPSPGQVTDLKTAARVRGLDVGLVQSDRPFSFVWGFHRSKLVMSTGLLAALTPTELVGVLEHEAAHHARRDNLVKLLLSVCAHATLAAPLARFVLRWRNEQVELLCDEVAAEVTAPLDIAEALVKVRRRAQTSATLPALGTSSFLPEDDRILEQRVRRLLTLADHPVAVRPGRVPKGFVPVALTSLFLSSLAVVAAWAPLAVHAATESVLHILR
ncbi:MAG: M56 family metallopeptidase [Candidatus Rokuibacteriota bacterium]